MNAKTLVVLLLTVLVSCDKAVFKKFDTGFEANRWQRSDVRSYPFTIETTGNYNLYIDFGYAALVQFPEIPIVVRFTAPTASQELPLVLRTKDGNGVETGDCAGDYCDLRQIVFEKKLLQPGNYKVQLINRFNHGYLPNVTGIGIRVTHAE